MSHTTTLRTRLALMTAVLSILATIIVASPASANDYPCVINNDEVRCGVDVDEFLKDLAKVYCDGGGGHIVTIYDGPDEYRHVDVCRMGGSGRAGDPETTLHAPVDVATHGPAPSVVADPSDVDPSEPPVQAVPADPGATSGELPSAMPDGRPTPDNEPVPNEDGDPAPARNEEPSQQADLADEPVRTTAKEQFERGRIHVNTGAATNRGSAQAPLVFAIGELDGHKPTKPFGVLILGGPGPAIGAVSPVNVGGVAASHYLGFDDSAQPAPTGETELAEPTGETAAGWWMDCGMLNPRISVIDCIASFVRNLQNPDYACVLESLGPAAQVWCHRKDGSPIGLRPTAVLGSRSRTKQGK